MTRFRFAATAASMRAWRRHRGRGGATAAIGAARHRPDIGRPALGIAAMWLTATAAAFGQAPSGVPTNSEILALMKAHCVQCHAAEPTHEAFARAPAGVLLETIDQVSKNAPRILNQVMVTRAMPLGNETGMTDQERERIAAWIESRAK